MIDNYSFLSYNGSMSKTVAFIGHRIVNENRIQSKLKSAVEDELEKGTEKFILGFHGKFDRLVLKILLEKKKNNIVYIDLVFPSLSAANSFKKIYPDTFKMINPVIYETELIHYKRKISYSNKAMIDDCDKLICYVDSDALSSGARACLLYAEKAGKDILNLYNDITDDRYRC